MKTMKTIINYLTPVDRVTKYLEEESSRGNYYVAHKGAPILRIMSPPLIQSYGFSKQFSEDEKRRYNEGWNAQHRIWHNEYLRNIENHIYWKRDS
jgi:hypothetical protein